VSDRPGEKCSVLSRRGRALLVIAVAVLLLAAYIGWTLLRLPEQPRRTAPERGIGALVDSPIRGR
jgi:cytochrome c-type biogenesis protein CcmH/NrfG